MTKTNEFFIWFFTGLNGLGGWFLFFLLAAAAVIFILYDTSRRRLTASGWKMGVILLACLMLPVMLFRFSGIETQKSLEQFTEIFFYLGLLGGVLPPVLAAGYFVTFRGIATCVRGHQYDTSLGSCPECRRIEEEERARLRPIPMPQPAYQAPMQPVGQQFRQPEPQRPSKPPAAAWLVGDGHNYQLFLGETCIGRGSSNDIQLGGDETISRAHAKISENNGHFRLYDLGAPNGTFVNGHRVREPQMIENGDEIRFGAQTTLRFTSGR
jgi:hypothetical protein